MAEKDLPFEQQPLVIPKSSESFSKAFTTDEIFDLTNLRSVVNIVPPVIRDAMLDPQLPRNWLDLKESDMMVQVEPHLDARDYRLRLTFWDEYNAAQDEGRMMKMDRMVKGSVSPKYFYTNVLKNHHKLIFMLSPPASYNITVKELLDLSLKRMREIMVLPIMDGKRRPNVHLIKEMIKIYQIVDARVQGGVKQQLDINQKSVNVNFNAGGSTHYAKNDAKKLVSKLDEEIETLEQELAALPEKSEVIKTINEFHLEKEVMPSEVVQFVGDDDESE